MRDGKLTLRSEPPLTSDRIVSLLLFGTPDGSFGAGGAHGSAGDSTATALGLAGGTAAKGLNRALAVLPLDVSAGLDTSTGTARPELDVQLTPRVTARMTRAIGEPTFGQSPDRAFLTLELRLRNSWALSAVVGDRGASALDLLWRRRYQTDLSAPSSGRVGIGASSSIVAARTSRATRIPRVPPSHPEQEQSRL